MNLAEVLKELGMVKAEANATYAAYKVFKEQEEELKSALLCILIDTGLKSAKGEEFTASITETPTVVITNETALMEWLQNRPDVEHDFYIGVKKPEFNTLAKQLLKENGELADGTTVEVRESLAIRANKKG